MIIDHDKELWLHDNPATQKSEVLHKGLPEIPATLTVIIAKDKK
jgi:hypothetical protein